VETLRAFVIVGLVLLGICLGVVVLVGYQTPDDVKIQCFGYPPECRPVYPPGTSAANPPHVPGLLNK
jgi:hypothetical protein